MRNKTLFIFEKTLAADNGTSWDFDKYINIPFDVKRIVLSSGMYYDDSTSSLSLTTIYSDLFKLAGNGDKGIACLLENRQVLHTKVEYLLPYPQKIENTFNFKLLSDPNDGTVHVRNTNDVLQLTIQFYDE